MRFHRFALVSGIAALSLSSCATKFSPTQRAALSTVAVAGTTQLPDAYEEPYGGDLEMRNRSANVPATGILGPLVGMGIGSAVAGTQNASFKGKSSGYFAAVQKNTPGDLDKALGEGLRKSLKSDRFFGSRLTGSSANVVTSEITSYRLIRAGKNEDGTLTFVPQIHAEIQLKDASGKKLAGGICIGTGTGAAPVAEYAASAAKTRQAYNTAVSNTVLQFMAALEAKTRD